MAVRDAETEVSTRKILVADSESQSRRELRSACEQDGYEVLEADNGADTLRLVTEQKPNLVLLELALPDMNGFDVCRDLGRLARERALERYSLSRNLDGLLGVYRALVNRYPMPGTASM